MSSLIILYWLLVSLHSMTPVRPLKLIIMGPPGAGKGTISSRIVADFGLTHLSTGDLLRYHIHNNTDIGREAQEYINTGRLVPDHVVNHLVLLEIERCGSNSWLVDGYPRTIQQAETLNASHVVDAVLCLQVPFESIIDRLRGRWTHPASGRVYNDHFHPPRVCSVDDVTGEPLLQRPDDQPDAVNIRLHNYEVKTSPLMEYYRKVGWLQEFRGTSTNTIWPLIRAFLAERMTPIRHIKYDTH